jgi:hypothetical protein
VLETGSFETERLAATTGTDFKGEKTSCAADQAQATN